MGGWGEGTRVWGGGIWGGYGGLVGWDPPPYFYATPPNWVLASMGGWRGGVSIEPLQQHRAPAVGFPIPMGGGGGVPISSCPPPRPICVPPPRAWRSSTLRRRRKRWRRPTRNISPPWPSSSKSRARGADPDPPPPPGPPPYWDPSPTLGPPPKSLCLCPPPSSNIWCFGAVFYFSFVALNKEGGIWGGGRILLGGGMLGGSGWGWG